MSSNEAANDPVAAVASATENMNRIREILFGEQARALDARLEALGGRLESERAALQGAFDAGMAAVRDQLAAASTQQQLALGAESEHRARALGELAQHLEETTRALDARLVQLDADTAEQVAALRRELLAGLDALEDRLQLQQQALFDQLAEQTARLREGKLDSERLAALFEALSGELRGAARGPGAAT